MLQKGEQDGETLGGQDKMEKVFANCAKCLKHNQVKVKKGIKERCETIKNEVKIVNTYKLGRKKNGILPKNERIV